MELPVCPPFPFFPLTKKVHVHLNDVIMYLKLSSFFLDPSFFAFPFSLFLFSLFFYLFLFSLFNLFISLYFSFISFLLFYFLFFRIFFSFSHFYIWLTLESRRAISWARRAGASCCSFRTL